jgi:hypothetical protein
MVPAQGEEAEEAQAEGQSELLGGPLVVACDWLLLPCVCEIKDRYPFSPCARHI